MSERRMMSYPDGCSEASMDLIDARTEIKDGSFVQCVFHVMGYVDPEGENQWFLCFVSDLPSTQNIGLLECAKLEVLVRSSGTVTNICLPPDPEDD